MTARVRPGKILDEQGLNDTKSEWCTLRVRFPRKGCASSVQMNGIAGVSSVDSPGYVSHSLVGGYMDNAIDSGVCKRTSMQENIIAMLRILDEIDNRWPHAAGRNVSPPFPESIVVELHTQEIQRTR